MREQPVIQLERVSKRFESAVALDEVTLQVPPGSVYALLGENGAGKTTAIRVMLGLCQPNRGHSHVLGFSSRLQDLGIRRQVGYVSDQPSLYEWMRVEELGWFAAGFYPAGFLPRYRELTRHFGLAPRKRVKELSRGMKAKVSLALALAHDPSLLILDEPTSGLDPLVRREFLESMVDRAALGKSVFLSSHQISEVERVADIVGILRQGRLVLVQRMEELKAGVRELTITFRESLSHIASIPQAQVLVREDRGRQCRLLVREWSETQTAMVRSDPAVQELSSRTPTLEDVFVAYMRPTTPSAAEGAVQVMS